MEPSCDHEVEDQLEQNQEAFADFCLRNNVLEYANDYCLSKTASPFDQICHTVPCYLNTVSLLKYNEKNPVHDVIWELNN